MVEEVKNADVARRSVLKGLVFSAAGLILPRGNQPPPEGLGFPEKETIPVKWVVRDGVFTPSEGSSSWQLWHLLGGGDELPGSWQNALGMEPGQPWKLPPVEDVEIPQNLIVTGEAGLLVEPKNSEAHGLAETMRQKVEELAFCPEVDEETYRPMAIIAVKRGEGDTLYYMAENVYNDQGLSRRLGTGGFYYNQYSSLAKHLPDIKNRPGFILSDRDLKKGVAVQPAGMYLRLDTEGNLQARYLGPGEVGVAYKQTVDKSIDKVFSRHVIEFETHPPEPRANYPRDIFLAEGELLLTPEQVGLFIARGAGDEFVTVSPFGSFQAVARVDASTVLAYLRQKYTSTERTFPVVIYDYNVGDRKIERPNGIWVAEESHVREPLGEILSKAGLLPGMPHDAQELDKMISGVITGAEKQFKAYYSVINGPDRFCIPPIHPQGSRGWLG
ncbi:hypothetical protein ISS42_02530 [Candidatus Shapirobacteria bacterium]|nr:hypothetical protein [Candidatus Shapirobacteria bacterium]